MKLGVLTVPLQGMSARDAFAYLHSLGVQTVELGTGGYTNNNHLKPEVYLDHPDKIAEFKDLLKEFDLEISVLSCHGNPVHPNKEKAAAYHQVFVDTWLSRRLRNLRTAQLGHLLLAGGLRRNSGLAVEPGPHPLLEGSRRNRPVLRRDQNRL